MIARHSRDRVHHVDGCEVSARLVQQTVKYHHVMQRHLKTFQQRNLSKTSSLAGNGGAHQSVICLSYCFPGLSVLSHVMAGSTELGIIWPATLYQSTRVLHVLMLHELYGAAQTLFSCLQYTAQMR